MKFQDFFTEQFLFQIDRVSVKPVDYWFAYFAIAAFVFAIVFRVLAWKSANPWRKQMLISWFRLFLFFAVAGGIWFAARYQYVAAIGTHATYYAVILVSVVWAAVLVKNRLTSYKGKLSSWTKEQEKAKYLKMSAK